MVPGTAFVVRRGAMTSFNAESRDVGVIGAGAIASVVGGQVANGAVRGMRLRGFLSRSAHQNLPGPEFSNLDDVVVPGGVVVEAAGHDAVRQFGAAVLSAGADFVCVSVGALADSELRSRLSVACERGGSRLVIPSGAVGGLDVLRAAASAGLDEVVIEQRKPARSLLSDDEAAALIEPYVVFDGTVAEVVTVFPRTTNVAAAVALAGLGFERTRAVVVADPALVANQVLLSASGVFGTLRLRLENVPSPNPRTSVIAAWSVVSTLRALAESVVFTS